MEMWSNGACLGYVIAALERLSYKPEEIQKIVSEIKGEGFDWTTLHEAEKHYQNSPY